MCADLDGTPLMFTLNTLSKPDSGNSSNGAPHAAPALLNNAGQLGFLAAAFSSSRKRSVMATSLGPAQS
jgi:hypothetical protein